MKNLIEHVKSQFKDRTQIIIYIFFFIIGLFLLSDFIRPNQKETPEETSLAADTFIPSGFTLVPIELINADSISSMIKEFAIVDLYAGSPTDKKASKIGSKLRLLRAPFNPERFAVLVPDSEAGQVLGSNAPISATILNPNLEGQGRIEQKKKLKSRVQYYQGDE